MGERGNFNKGFIDGLPIPEKGNVFHYDTNVRGLALLITSNGAKTFYVYRKIEGKPVQYRLGRYPDLSVDQVRKMARDFIGAIARGEDPTRKRKQLDPTFGELFAWFIEIQAQMGKKSWEAYQYHYDRYLSSLAKVKASKITRTDLRELHARLGSEHGPYSANRALAIARSVFNKAINQELISGVNPASGIEMFPERSRDRRLTSSEREAFFRAVMEEPNETLRDYIILSLFTGARRANVVAMRWEEIDFEESIWRIPETKNGTPQTIPLLKNERSILRARFEKAEGPWVFPGTGRTGHLVEPKTGWKRILERAGIEDLRIHDLRRSLGSWMVDTGAPLAVISKALNHMDQRTTQIYARLSMDPVKAAKEKALEMMLAGIDLGAIMNAEETKTPSEGGKLR